MSSAPALTPDLVGLAEPTTRSRGQRLFCQAENLLLVIPLAAMLLLPVVEIVLRMVFKTGV